MDKQEVISKLYQLQKAMAQTAKEWDELLTEGQSDNAYLIEQKHDQLYTSYWTILMNEVDAKYRDYVERIIGTGHFTEIIYIDELDMIMQCDNTIVYEYQGYTLKSELDEYGNLIYRIYDSNGHEYCDAFKCVNNCEAIIMFQNMLKINDFT